MSLTAKEILALVCLKTIFICCNYCCVITAVNSSNHLNGPIFHLVVYRALIEAPTSYVREIKNIFVLSLLLSL